MAHFELLEEKVLGEGSFGKVYQCHWHGSLAAAKLFNVTEADESSGVSQEIKLIKELHNDYIIQFFGTIRYKSKLCLITSFAEKGSLYQALVRHSLTKEQKPRIITGLIKGMQYLKSNNVVHRDFKSPNVLLDWNYVPKICDFGLALLKLNSATHTKSSSAVGTTRWMAPELFQRRPRYSFASDVYALGIVIWEVLTEQLPYADVIDIDTVRAFIKDGEHEDIPEDIPEHYKSIIKNSWHMDPKERITVEQISKMNDQALPQTDVSYVDNVFEDDMPASIEALRIDSGYESSKQRSTTSFHFPAGSTPAGSVVADSIPAKREPTDYPTTFSQYLQDTGGIVDTKSRLASITNVHGTGFTEWIRTAAENGDNDAMTVLGEMYYHGYGVQQSYQAALSQFSTATERIRDQDNSGSTGHSSNATKQGNARAQSNLGYMYEYGCGVPQRQDKAIEWYKKAAEQGDAVAQNNLGQMYQCGRSVRQSNDEAVGWYKKAAERGNAEGQNNLGWMYQNGLGVPQDDEKAVIFYTKSAVQGNMNGQNNLGWMYQSGRGVPQNYYSAVEWYEKSAEQGNASAQNNLGWMYQNGYGTLQSDAKAVEWYKKSAMQGNTNAQSNLAWMYQNGRGVPQDDQAAAGWLMKAAEQGDANAQNSLGLMYQTGQGVPQNDNKAVQWYTRGAEQGHGDALNNLGWAYQLGLSVPQNDEKAVELYRMSAEQNNPNGQNNLGWMYQNGRGVPQDDNKAVELYKKAAEQGNQSAQINLTRMHEKGRGVSQSNHKANK